MRIGQLAQLVGVDTQTIRFYEQQGLLPPPGRQENGYRVYTEKHVESYSQIWWMAVRRQSCLTDRLLALHPGTGRCSRPVPAC